MLKRCITNLNNSKETQKHLPNTRSAARTTQPKEGKRGVMSNKITQWVNTLYRPKRTNMNPNGAIEFIKNISKHTYSFKPKGKYTHIYTHTYIYIYILLKQGTKSKYTNA